MQNKVIKLAIVATISAFIIGCSSGGSGSSPTAQGRFKDANTDGLTYTGAFPGVTKDGGRFNYRSGSVIEFSIGDIVLGTATGKVIITPVDLVPGGSLTSNKVVKISQLLQSLDRDSNLDNGIDIHSDTAEAMSTDTAEVNAIITALDDTATANIDTEVGNLINNIAKTADSSGTYTAVTRTAAIQHVKETLQCAYSGGYQGSGENSDIDIEGGLVIESDGDAVVIIVDGADITTNSATINFNTKTFTFTSSVADVTRGTETGTITITATLDDINRITGEITDVDNTTYTFSASRVGGSVDARYRFVGTIIGSSNGFFTLDIDDNDKVTGKGYIPIDDELFDLTGSIDRSTSTPTANITAVFEDEESDDITATATIDFNAKTIMGRYVSDSNTGSFSAEGCELNTVKEN